MLYFILIALILASLLVILGFWLRLREKNQEILFLEEESMGLRAEAREHDQAYLATVNLLYEQIEETQQELQEARNNLSMVLTAEPVPFNQVAVELGLHGVVYQFLSIDDTKEITA